MTALRILFFFVSLAIFAAANIYLYRRLVRDVTGARAARILGGVALGLPFVAMPLIRFGFRESSVPSWLSAVFMGWWGVAIYTLFALLVVEGVLLFMRRRRFKAESRATTVEKVESDRGRSGEEVGATDESRRVFLSRALAVGALSVGGGVAGYGVSRAFAPPEVSETIVPLPGLPKALDGFTIAHLTDLHVGAVIQERELAEWIGIANRLRPDLVAITGDLVDGSPDKLGSIVALLRGLKSRHGTYFASGNHEYYSGWDRWEQALLGFGVTVLRNRGVVIGDAGGSFDLLGVDDWHSPDYDLAATAGARDVERPSVLLAHQPVNLAEVSAHRIGLQISGHTHGGQLFPGPLIGAAIYGSRVTGLSRLGHTWQFTSRGCGFVGPPMRVGSPPEIARLVLVSRS